MAGNGAPGPAAASASVTVTVPPATAKVPERSTIPDQMHFAFGGQGETRSRAENFPPSANETSRTYARLPHDALVNVPEYYHNAVLYSAVYRFLSPARQGAFEALVRDLSSLPLGAASTAVEEGRVAHRGSDATLVWEPGEMIMPLTEPVRRWLEAPAVAEAVRGARESARFHVREKR